MEEIKEGDGAGMFIRFIVKRDDGTEWLVYDACNVSDGLDWLANDLDDIYGIFTDEWMNSQAAYGIACGNEEVFWYLEAINKLGAGFNYDELNEFGVTIARLPRQMLHTELRYTESETEDVGGTIWWSTDVKWDTRRGEEPLYHSMRDHFLVTLAHELQHAEDDFYGYDLTYNQEQRDTSQFYAITVGNIVRMSLIGLAPRAYKIGEGHTSQDYIRPGGCP